MIRELLDSIKDHASEVRGTLASSSAGVVARSLAILGADKAVAGVLIGGGAVIGIIIGKVL